MEEGKTDFIDRREDIPLASSTDRHLLHFD